MQFLSQTEPFKVGCLIFSAEGTDFITIECSRKVRMSITKNLCQFWLRTVRHDTQQVRPEWPVTTPAQHDHRLESTGVRKEYGKHTISLPVKSIWLHRYKCHSNTQLVSNKVYFLRLPSACCISNGATGWKHPIPAPCVIQAPSQTRSESGGVGGRFISPAWHSPTLTLIPNESLLFSAAVYSFEISIFWHSLC